MTYLIFVLIIQVVQIYCTQSTGCCCIEEGKVYTVMENKYKCMMETFNSIIRGERPIVAYVQRNPVPLNQNWYVKGIDGLSNTYLIVNAMTNLVVDSTGNILTNRLPTCAASQQFQFVQGPNNVCYIFAVSSSSNMVIATTTQRFTQLVVESFSNSAKQQWIFTENLKTQYKSVYQNCTIIQSETTPEVFSQTINESVYTTNAISTTTINRLNSLLSNKATIGKFVVNLLFASYSVLIIVIKMD